MNAYYCSKNDKKKELTGGSITNMSRFWEKHDALFIFEEYEIQNTGCAKVDYLLVTY